MTQNLSVSRLVNFASVVSAQAAQAPSQSTGLVLGTSTVIDVVQRMRTYDSLAAVAADFGTAVQEYLTAVAWFAQSPQPTSMNVGRWANAASAGQLICGPLSSANSLISAWTSVVAGSFKIAVDGGVATNVPALNFAAATNFNYIAAAIQTAIQLLGGAFANVTCVYNAVYNNFVITSGTTGATSAVSLMTAGSTGTDISAQISGTTATGAYAANGVVVQTALATVALFDNQFGGQWYHLFIPSADDADAEAIAPYIDGDTIPHFFWFNSQETAMLSLGDTTHIGYELQQLGSQHTAVQYSSQSLYAAWSMAARISTVNWEGSGTALSLMYKQEPGIAPETLTDTQITALESYDVNVYAAYAAPGTPIIEPGICPSGQFIDTIVGVDWLRNQIQSNVFDILVGQTAKVPQTDAGVNTIKTGVANACAQGIANGLGAPGTWNTTGFGTLVEGATLDTGYYVYAPPIASQSEADRQERICPPIQVAFKLAGAINTVSGTVFVNQ